MATFAYSFLFFLLATFALAAYGQVGVDYGRDADHLLPPVKVVELLKSQGIDRVKIYDTDPEVLSALANSGIRVVVELRNELLSNAAADQSFTDSWVESSISSHPGTTIESIAVGNEVFRQVPQSTGRLVPAMKNVRNSLVKYGLDSKIKVSTPLAFDTVSNSFPPSAGRFRSDLVEPVLRPMLEFLSSTASYVMVNLYPYDAYIHNPDISLDYALFNDNPGIVDSGNGLKYTNLFDAQLDSVYAAMSAIGLTGMKRNTSRILASGFSDLKARVTESGWPSMSGPPPRGGGKQSVNKNDVEVELRSTDTNLAATYNGNLVRKVRSGRGTPLRPQDPLNVYIFSLFNEDKKQGDISERNFGLFYPDGRPVYASPFLSNSGGGDTWCVANKDAGGDQLKAALDYACGQGGADCRPIQPGAACYEPNTLEAHASYAFNSYYQKQGRKAGSCDFQGAAHVVTQAPKYGQCQFPTTPASSKSWCVANVDAGKANLQAALDYACGQGGADCRPIQVGAACYDPNTLEAHASFAFNSYYQNQGCKAGSCDFHGAASVVTQARKYGNCELPSAC